MGLTKCLLWLIIPILLFERWFANAPSNLLGPILNKRFDVVHCRRSWITHSGESNNSLKFLETLLVLALTWFTYALIVYMYI